MPGLRFPKYDLEASLEVAWRMQNHGGGAANADQLAVFLSYKSRNNGAFLTRVAAAKLFGLIEGQASGYKVTQRALDILQPDYPATADRARLDAFLAVPLFAAFFERYEGQVLPDPKGMKNALTTQFAVPAAQTATVLSRLLESAEQAGLFKVAGPTKMIRPSLNAAQRQSESDAVPPPAPSQPPLATGSYPKLLEGALEQLPPQGEQWGEESLADWLDLFEMALRVVYKLPRKSGASDRVQTGAPGTVGSGA